MKPSCYAVWQLFRALRRHAGEGQKDCTGPPSWEFEVSGRLIERAESEGTAAAPMVPAPLPGSAAALGGQQSSLGPRFSSLIRRLTIRLDPEQYPADGVITWSKALHEGPAKDKFSVRSAAIASPAKPKLATHLPSKRGVRVSAEASSADVALHQPSSSPVRTCELWSRREAVVVASGP